MRSKGFTLIELMIVVVIIGVLAVVAMGSYNKYMASAKKAEVAAMFAEIRAKEEAYRAEFSAYLSLDVAEAANGGWPTLGGGEPKAKTWAPAPAAWVTMGLAPPKSQLYCAYQVIAGAPALLPAGGRGKLAFNNIAPSTAWWYAIATCDNDGNNAVNAVYVTTSDRDTVYDENATK